MRVVRHMSKPRVTPVLSGSVIDLTTFTRQNINVWSTSIHSCGVRNLLAIVRFLNSKLESRDHPPTT